MENNAGYYCGRPFGGLAIIVKASNHFNVREISLDSDRVMCVSVYDLNDTIVHTLVNVYMPFHDGTVAMAEELVGTLDVMQSIVENVNGRCPIKFFGDFNCQLPKSTPRSVTWYRSPGFNRHSSIVYDFIASNEMVVADFLSDQSVQYTYFCHARNAYTWIDHVLCFDYDAPSVHNCSILPLSLDNDSDHLPLQCTFSMSISQVHGCLPTQLPPSRSCYARWDDPVFCQKYKECLEEKLMHLTLNFSPNADSEEALREVDQHMAAINEALDAAVQEAGCRSRSFKPKPYWCPELSSLRDRKRFWWRIWNEAGRPRAGHLFDCYKGCKRLFRQRSRYYMALKVENEFEKTNKLFRRGKMRDFWRRVRKRNQGDQHSQLNADALASHYETIMTDQENLSEDQRLITNAVQQRALEIREGESDISASVSARAVSKYIEQLRPRCAPGADRITVEHLKRGNSQRLCTLLASIYTRCLRKGIVPSAFTIGVIVPIFKKPSLNPNEAKSYRPVTLSSVHSKVLELIMLPPDNVSSSQYGFRKHRGTAFACSLFNDVQSYFRFKKSPLFSCSLDAEKCFDSLWHSALFFKLMHKIPDQHWLTLHFWYSRLKAMVKWNGAVSRTFCVSRGTRQGSILSPSIFNCFIDGLLEELAQVTDGVSIQGLRLNSFAYADDVTLFCSTVPGLQRLIDVCSAYAGEWRFSFGIAKTKCMISGQHNFHNDPKWYLNGVMIDNVDEMDILGVTFSSSCSSASHVTKRADKCKRSFYSLRDAGMSYPGCSSDVKAHMWNVICQPVLIYGAECINISRRDSSFLNTTQSNCIKQALEFSKRVRSTHLLDAMQVCKASDKADALSCSLLNRIMRIPCSAQRLCSLFLSLYTCSGILVPGSLVERVVRLGLSPTRCALGPPSARRVGGESSASGITDSVRTMIMHSNFIKPYSEEHVLATLLIRAF